jgi:hypothetical protein
MKNILSTLIAAGVMFGVAGVSYGDDTIKDRKVNQQERIGNGVKNGSLTPRETGRLEHKETALNREIHQDRVQNGGNLTNKEKAQVNRQQNRLSKDIYKQKHGGQHQ